MLDSSRLMSDEQMMQEEKKTADDSFKVEQEANAKKIAGTEQDRKRLQQQTCGATEQTASTCPGARRQGHGDQRASRDEAKPSHPRGGAPSYEPVSSGPHPVHHGTPNVGAHGEQLRFASGGGPHKKLAHGVDAARQGKIRATPKRAAASAYATGESMGGPAGIVLGPVFAAAAFAGVMAFEEGD